MKYTKLSPLMISLLLAACGGGGGGSSAPAANNGSSSAPAAAKTEVTQGMVTGFGSVIVNGVHYDVGSAAIDVDGKSLVESDLKVGQIVRITGTLNADGKTGKATKLEGETQLVGPIASIDLDAGVLVALGQTILLTADTFYDDDMTASQLKVGDIIEVSSYLNSEGVMVATRIDWEDDDDSFQLSGVISALDTLNKTFVINGTLVDYSNATLAALRGAVLEDGLKLRVTGDYNGDVFTARGNLHPSHLGFKRSDDFDDDDLEIKLSGPVADLIPGVSFTINGVLILINSDTEFEDGTAGDLVDGVMVEIEATLDANQNLVADEIELNYRAKISNKGLLESVDLTTNTLVVNGMVFEVTDDTSFNDRSREKVRFFDIEDLRTGDTLHLRGYTIAATATTAERHIASRIERHNPHAFGNDDWKLEIEGLVEAVGLNSITVEGQVIQISPLTRIEGFRNMDLFLAAALGREVEVRALTQNGVATAIRIELEDEDDDGNDDDSETSSSSSRSSSSQASSSSEASESESSSSSSQTSESSENSESSSGDDDEETSSSSSLSN
uniref:DUF5666 domain-containing protein n=1 Tax=Cellvibrio fontiphilus TaxID=1815559 RepID=UPI002B4BE53A|nr:DUF5666 domain-containing protein [Cellvibrio fontiphilus]